MACLNNESLDLSSFTLFEAVSMTARLLPVSNVGKQKLMRVFVPPCCGGRAEMVEVIWTIIQWGAWLVLQCWEEASFFR